MSIFRSVFPLVALAAISTAFMSAAQAQSGQQDVAKVSQESAAVAAVASNRAAVIEQIVSKWQGWTRSPAASEQFRLTLQAASDRQLVRVQNATTYDQVRVTLLGRMGGAMDTIGILSLGDTTNDLVFTPNNPPCRVFDTRNIGGPGLGVPPPALTIKSYQVYGSGATIGAQGGNPLGCAAPKGEPVAVSANFTAVPVGTAGHIRVYPFGGALPTVSFLNFNATGNIANSGIVSTCFGCPFDLNVYNAAVVHHIGDIMGFFYPAPIDYPDQTSFASPVAVFGDNFAMSATVVTPTHNGKCLVTTHVQLAQDPADTYAFTFVRTARQIGAGAPVNDGTTGLYTSPISGRNFTAPVTATFVWDVVAGTNYRFGCYANTGGDLVGNALWCRTTHLCF